MSQSRNRRPSRPREPQRSAPVEYAKDNCATRDSYKIPSDLRYDLENALLGLCDVWFEEIKPHLVKNNLKVHTGGVLNEGGYSELERLRSPQRARDEPRRGRTKLDPGAASDNRRRPADNSTACSPTRRAVSRPRSPRPPSPCPRPLSPNNLCKLLQIPDVEKTRQKRPPVRRTLTPPVPRLIRKYEGKVDHSSEQCVRRPVQKVDLRDYHTTPNQRNIPSSPKQLPVHTPAPRPRGCSPPVTYLPNINNSIKQTTVQQPLTPPVAVARTFHDKYLSNKASGRDWIQPSVQRIPPRSPPPSPTRANQQKLRNSLNQTTVQQPLTPPVAVARTFHDKYLSNKASGRDWIRPSVQRIPPRSPPPSPTRANQQKLRNRLNQDTNISGPKRKTKQNLKSSQYPSPKPPKRAERPCCAACAASVATTSVPQQHDAARPRLLRTRNTLPSKPHPDTRNMISFWSRRPDANSHVPVLTKDRANSPFRARSNSPPSLNVAAGDYPFSQDFFNFYEPSGKNRTQEHAAVRSRVTGNFACPLLRDACLMPPAPLHAKCLVPQQNSRNQPAPTPLSPAPSEDETWFTRIFKNYTMAPITEKSRRVKNISASSSKLTISNQLQLDNRRHLFSKDLIDIIGSKNDQRLRVLFENRRLDDELQPSTMCLVGSRRKRINTAPKKMPWRYQSHSRLQKYELGNHSSCEMRSIWSSF